MRFFTRKFLSAVTAVVLLISILSVSAFAAGNEPYVIEDEHMSFVLPTNTVVLKPDTALESADWAAAGISDPASAIKNYKDLSAIANFVYIGGARSVYLSTKTSSSISEIYNLTTADDAVVQESLLSLEEMNNTEGITSVAELVTINNYLFVKDTITYSLDDVYSQEICIVTIMNGVSYTFSTHSNEPLTDDETAFLESIVSGLTFTEISEKPTNEYTQEDMLKSMIPLAVIVLVILAFFIYTHTLKKKFLKNKEEYAAQITKFRQERKVLEADPNFKESEPLFLNKSIHSDAALHSFSYFHAYRKHLSIIPCYIISAAAALYLAFTLKDQLIWTLILTAVSCFCLYKIFSAPGKNYRTFIRMYKYIQNRVAIFTFREDSFKLSGLQANGVFPYFQITDAYETKNCFYLYFREDNAYIIDKKGFALGDSESFRAFLKTKLGKRFHKR